MHGELSQNRYFTTTSVGKKVEMVQGGEYIGKRVMGMEVQEWRRKGRPKCR